MSNHPEAGQENTHPATYDGVQLQAPAVGGQGGTGEEDGHIGVAGIRNVGGVGWRWN